VELHARYVALLPKIKNHAQIVFRHIPCCHRREDAVQEVCCLGWKWFKRLCERGKDAEDFPMAFAELLARAVKSGRRLVGMNKAKDPMNPLTQKRAGFTVEPLPISSRTSLDHIYADPHGQQSHDTFEERLQDNTLTPIPDQVQFRIDFPAWLKTLTGRERRIIKAMARNERTKDISQEFEVSPGRISQYRQEFHKDWNRFCDGSSSEVL
jgi:hypothetical protein